MQLLGKGLHKQFGAGCIDKVGRAQNKIYFKMTRISSALSKPRHNKENKNEMC